MANLYADVDMPVRGNGLLTGHCPTLDAKQLPLYQSACEMLGRQQFMSEGKILPPAGSIPKRLETYYLYRRVSWILLCPRLRPYQYQSDEISRHAQGHRHGHLGDILCSRIGDHGPTSQ